MHHCVAGPLKKATHSNVQHFFCNNILRDSKDIKMITSMLFNVNRDIQNAWQRLTSATAAAQVAPLLCLEEGHVPSRGRYSSTDNHYSSHWQAVRASYLWRRLGVSCTSERTSVPKARPRARSACGRPGVWKIRPANLILSVTIGTQAAAWRLERTALHTRHEFKKSDATWQLLH